MLRKYKIFPVLILLFVSCNESPTISKEPGNDFKAYWYSGKAEISSYELKQNRYNQTRNGKSVLVFVTEPFKPNKQVKADGSDASNVNVLKLNSTKKFLTGIYPYSIMNSSFYPVTDDQNAIKLTTTVQEWCGHVFAQLNNRSEFEIKSYSYFEKEGDQSFKMKKVPLEAEVWNKIRINPSNLGTGQFEMLPSFEYLRLKHKEIKPYKVTGAITSKKGMMTYSLEYPELARRLSITFQNEFPYIIESWIEKSADGYGAQAKRINTIKSAYWGENSNGDEKKREKLGLPTTYQ